MLSCSDLSEVTLAAGGDMNFLKSTGCAILCSFVIFSLGYWHLQAQIGKIKAVQVGQLPLPSPFNLRTNSWIIPFIVKIFLIT